MGLQYAWQPPGIRMGLLMIAMIHFAVLSPMVIGVAELVTLRFGDSAITFGYLQSAYGVGALFGVAIATRLSLAFTFVRQITRWNHLPLIKPPF
jgi:hypothetical protein